MTSGSLTHPFIDLSNARSLLLRLWTNDPCSWLAAIDNVTGICKVCRFNWPEELDDAFSTFVQKYVETHNIYFCVNNTNSPIGRQARYVEKSKVVYADLDDKCSPIDLLVKPSYLVQTSASKYQAFWVMEDVVSADVTSDISRKIASYHGLDACWDKVRLMRLPGTLNHKYTHKNNKHNNENNKHNNETTPYIEPFTVKLITSRDALFRPKDFNVYPEINFKYISINKTKTTLAAINNVPKYADLDIEEQERIDRYTEDAVQYEIFKLLEFQDLGEGERYEYSSNKGMLEFGWDMGCMWVARCLVEIANSPWNAYTLDQAKQDFMTNAPTDMNWTKNDLHKKWQSALDANNYRTIKYRSYPRRWED